MANEINGAATQATQATQHNKPSKEEQKYKPAIKPLFSEIRNVTEMLEQLVSQYGFNSVLNHLGLLAFKQVSRAYAVKIWGITNSDK